MGAIPHWSALGTMIKFWDTLIYGTQETMIRQPTRPYILQNWSSTSHTRGFLKHSTGLLLNRLRPAIWPIAVKSPHVVSILRTLLLCPLEMFASIIFDSDHAWKVFNRFSQSLNSEVGNVHFPSDLVRPVGRHSVSSLPWRDLFSLVTYNRHNGWLLSHRPCGYLNFKEQLSCKDAS